VRREFGIGRQRLREVAQCCGNQEHRQKGVTENRMHDDLQDWGPNDYA
jgi:hypothetical protein